MVENCSINSLKRKASTKKMQLREQETKKVGQMIRGAEDEEDQEENIAKSPNRTHRSRIEEEKKNDVSAVVNDSDEESEPLKEDQGNIDKADKTDDSRPSSVDYVKDVAAEKELEREKEKRRQEELRIEEELRKKRFFFFG